MRLIVADDYQKLSRIGAMLIAAHVVLKTDLVLGLATGSTPVGTYRELVRLHAEGVVDFSGIKTFNLDEYIGLDEADPQSYHWFMKTNLFSGINVSDQNIHIPPGIADDLQQACLAYERSIGEAGGLDLLLLGIGRNGHIGFNEPDVKFEDLTHIVELDEQTIEDNARFFPNREAVPRRAISMGIQTIMRAKRILLLATGEEKRHVLKNMLQGPITPTVPASVLRLHPQVTVVADRAAASLIDGKGGSAHV